MVDSVEHSQIATANGIRYLPKRNKLFCFVCSKQLTDIHKHIFKKKHKLSLESFKFAFEDRGKKVFCKICNVEIDWKLIKRHGKKDKITPWYTLKNPVCKTFFRNHTGKFTFACYCFLCERLLDSWDTAESHFTEDDHQKLKKMYSGDIEFGEKIYMLLIAHGLVPGRNKTINCKVCERTVPITEDIKKHVKTAEHKENKEKFLVDLRKKHEERKSFGNEDSESESDSESLDTLEESIEKLVKADPLKNDQIPKNTQAPNSGNMIFDFNLHESPEEAFPELKKSERKTKDISKLVETGKTKWKKNVLQENPTKSSREFSEHEYRSINYIVSSTNDLCKAMMSNDKQRKRKIAKQSKDEPKPYCLICYSEIPGHHAVKDHLKGKRHENARNKYGCDNINLIDGEHYYCTSCDFNISGFDNVYRHITSNSHLSVIRRTHGENHVSESIPNELANAMETEEIKASDEIMPYMYIVEQNARKSFCQICDETQFPVITKNINDHITSQRHKLALKRYGCDNIVLKINESYHCKCCNFDISNIESVYLHIKEKRHMSSLIKVCSKQEGRRDKRKIENPILPENDNCQNLLSGYITKQIDKSLLNKVNVNSQRSMISNFTVEPNDVHCSMNSSRFEPEYSNSMASQKSEDFDHKTIENAIDAFNQLEDDYKMPSDNQISDDVTKNDIPLHNCNTILDSIDTAKQPELKMMISSMAMELSRFIANCNTKEMKRRAEKSQNRVETKPILEIQGVTKKFYCTVCNAKTENKTELHVHMASHYTEEFVKCKRNRGNEMINSVANNQMPEEGNNNPEIQQQQQNISVKPEILLGEKIASSVDNNLRNASSHLVNSITALSNLEIAEIQTSAPPECGTPEKKKSPKVVNMNKVAQHLDFDHDYIYDLVDKMEEVELGMMLGLEFDSSKMYCLICRNVVNYTLDNYYEHLLSIDHCDYLQEMETDKALFKDFTDQFSDLDLANEYMQEISEKMVRCIICDEEICNNDRTLEAHIYHEIHERKCEETRATAKRHFEVIAPQMHCDWYDVQKYWCVICQMNTDSEVNFVKHLMKPKHKRAMNRPENVGKKMMFDFCATCALLWYGHRCTYSYHSDIQTHKWLKRDGHYVLTELPGFAKWLLGSMNEFIDEKIKYLNTTYITERAKEEELIRDLLRVAKIRFPRSKVYPYGSRVSGLGSEDSDMDVFLDCRNVYNGNSATMNDLMFFMNGVHQSLCKESQSWDVEELLTDCRSPIIRVCHRATGLNCDISFENGLAVENTNLIKTFNEIFPMCRKITLFLKQWLLYCGLSGSRQITSYALYWYVIFYLQKESILPSVAMLIAIKKRSHKIAGWEVGVTHDFIYNEEFSNFTLKEFLIRFFTFYAEFNFRYDVACPLLGEVVKKRAFIDPEYLPKEMEPYLTYLRGPGEPEPFRIDSPMCIQDPFDLQHNLTKAVKKIYLNRFRKCCTKSLEILRSS